MRVFMALGMGDPGPHVDPMAEVMAFLEEQTETRDSLRGLLSRLFVARVSGKLSRERAEDARRLIDSISKTMGDADDHRGRAERDLGVIAEELRKKKRKAAKSGREVKARLGGKTIAIKP